MELRVEREAGTGERTPGKLYVDGQFFCHTLEDQVREVEGRPVSEWKVYGKTAIPFGRYRCTMIMSPRFRREMVWVRDVPGFEGILIHNGKDETSTEGCLLVHDRKDFQPPYDRAAMQRLETLVRNTIVSGEEVWITYVQEGA